MRVALKNTGARRIAEASPQDKVWGIGLTASDPRAASPISWCGLNLLGQALKRTRETPRQNKSGDTEPDILAPRDDDTDDTVFEVDLITHVRLDRSPLNTDSLPDGYAREVLLTYAPRVTSSIMPEQGPDLASGVVSMDDAIFTTLISLSTGASAKSRLNSRALCDTGSTQSFIHQGAFDQMVTTGAADAPYVRATTPKSWSGIGSQEILSTSRQDRMIVQVHNNGVPSASLAVWMHLVPDETMHCPIPGIGLGGLAPFLPTTLRSGLGGLSLTHDDSRTYCAQLPPPNMVGSIDRPHLVSAGNPRSSYAFRAHENDTRPPHTRRSQSQTAILASDAPSLPDYRIVARSGFGAPDASVPPSLRTSPPPRSACLGSTALMAPLLGSLRPIRPRCTAAFGFDRLYGPHSLAARESSASLAPAA